MAENELTQVILADLRESKAWQNDASTLLREISERLAKVETQLAAVQQQQEKQQDNVDELESIKDQGIGIKYLLCFIAAAIPGIVALIKPFLP